MKIILPLLYFGWVLNSKSLVVIHLFRGILYYRIILYAIWYEFSPLYCQNILKGYPPLNSLIWNYRLVIIFVIPTLDQIYGVELKLKPTMKSLCIKDISGDNVFKICHNIITALLSVTFATFNLFNRLVWNVGRFIAE